MVDSIVSWPIPDDPAPGLIDDEAFDLLLYARHLVGDLLTQTGVVAQLLWLDAVDKLLGLLHQRIQLGVAADVEVLKPAKELGQVANARVAEDTRLTILAGSQPFGQVGQ
jgi:hypothetical protein